MAIFHYNQSGVNPSEGGSAVKSSAYITGASLFRERTGERIGYGRSSRVVETGIVLPEGAPPEYADREVLWNAAEEAWGGGNESVAQRTRMALPKELAGEPSAFSEIVEDYVCQVVARTGCAVEYAIHAPEDGGANWHAHTLKSALRLGPRGFERPEVRRTTKLYLCRDPEGGDRYVPADEWQHAKTAGFEKVFNFKDGLRRSMSEAERDGLTRADRKSKAPVAVTVRPDGSRAFDFERAELVALRKLWADCCNRVLAERGLDVRVDHRSNRERGLSAEPELSLSPGDYRREVAEREAAEREGRRVVPVTEKGRENFVRHARNRAVAESEAALATLGSAEAALAHAADDAMEDARRWTELRDEEGQLREEADAVRPDAEKVEAARRALFKAECAERDAEEELRARRFDLGGRARRAVEAAHSAVVERKREKEVVDERAARAKALEERAHEVWCVAVDIPQAVAARLRRMAADVAAYVIRALREAFPDFAAQLEHDAPWIARVGGAEPCGALHQLVAGVEDAVRGLEGSLREVEGDRAATREKCRLAVARATGLADLRERLHEMGVGLGDKGNVLSVQASGEKPIPMAALDSSYER